MTTMRQRQHTRQAREGTPLRTVVNDEPTSNGLRLAVAALARDQAEVDAADSKESELE